MVFTSITFGGLKLNVIEFSQRTKVPATIKQKNGQGIAQLEIPGRNQKDFNLTFRGRIFAELGSTITQIRTDLEALDDASPKAYTDGFISGSFIVDNGGLNFEDSGIQAETHYEYTLTLIQFQQ